MGVLFVSLYDGLNVHGIDMECFHFGGSEIGDRSQWVFIGKVNLDHSGLMVICPCDERRGSNIKFPFHSPVEIDVLFLREIDVGIV